MNRYDVHPRTKINDALLMALDIESKDYRFTVAEKFYLLVKKTGKKYWQLKYKKENGQWSFHNIGVFPTVNLKQARKLADEFFEQLDQGDFSFGKNTKLDK